MILSRTRATRVHGAVRVVINHRSGRCPDRVELRFRASCAVEPPAVRPHIFLLASLGQSIAVAHWGVMISSSESGARTVRPRALRTRASRSARGLPAGDVDRHGGQWHLDAGSVDLLHQRAGHARGRRRAGHDRGRPRGARVRAVERNLVDRWGPAFSCTSATSPGTPSSCPRSTTPGSSRRRGRPRRVRSAVWTANATARPFVQRPPARQHAGEPERDPHRRSRRGRRWSGLFLGSASGLHAVAYVNAVVMPWRRSSSWDSVWRASPPVQRHRVGTRPSRSGGEPCSATGRTCCSAACKCCTRCAPGS